MAHAFICCTQRIVVVVILFVGKRTALAGAMRGVGVAYSSSLVAVATA